MATAKQMLAQAKKQFSGQKAKVDMSGGYDNSLIPDANYPMEIVHAKVEPPKWDENGLSQNMRFRITEGEYKGRSFFPAYTPDLLNSKGIVQAAKNIQLVLGDCIPGKTLNDGQFEINIPAFLDVVEELTAGMMGKHIIGQAKTSSWNDKETGEKKTKQGVWIRQVVESGTSVKQPPATKTTEHEAGSSMKMTSKKKVAKKKVRRKK
jgi:hypothetical protein